MLGRDFSHITNKICPSQHKTLPPHIEIIQLEPNKCFKHIHYLANLEEVLSLQKIIHTKI